MWVKKSMKVSSKQKKLIKLHAQLCRELGMTPAPIVFINNFESFGRHLTEYGIILINLALLELFGKPPELTLAHETWHNYQWRMGWISETHWRGKKITQRMLNMPHRKRPWEIGAIRYEKKIGRRLGLTE
jgi:hypothetical protein